MKLDRNITNPRRGKYALIKLRDAEPKFTETKAGEEYVSVPASAVDFGNTDDSDFFVIRLKDRFCGPALRAYASAITAHLATLPLDDKSREGLVEYHHEIIRLAEQVAANPNQRTPD